MPLGAALIAAGAAIAAAAPLRDGFNVFAFAADDIEKKKKAFFLFVFFFKKVNRAAMSGVDLSAFSTEELEALLSPKHSKLLKATKKRDRPSTAPFRALLRGRRGDDVDIDYSRFYGNEGDGFRGEAEPGKGARESLFFGVEELDPNDYFGVGAIDGANDDEANDASRATKKRSFLTSADAAVRKKKKKKKDKTHTFRV